MAKEKKSSLFKARSNRNKNNVRLLFSYDVSFIVFDVETTGKDAKVDEIVELSAIKYNIKNGEAHEEKTIDIFIKPSFWMDEEVINIHHITNEFLEDKPREDEVFADIKELFGENSILIGYNTQFDIDFLKALYRRQGEEFKYQIMLDVLEMSRDLVFDAENYQLETIVKMYHLEDDITFHSSIDDVRATARLLFTFKNEYDKIIDTPKETIVCNFSYWWKGRNKYQRGIYFDTNFGRIYFNTYRKVWCSSTCDFSVADVDAFERAVCKRAGIKFAEFSKLTEKKYNELKKERKI